MAFNGGRVGVPESEQQQRLQPMIYDEDSAFVAAAPPWPHPLITLSSFPSGHWPSPEILGKGPRMGMIKNFDPITLQD